MNITSMIGESEKLKIAVKITRLNEIDIFRYLSLLLNIIFSWHLLVLFRFINILLNLHILLYHISFIN